VSTAPAEGKAGTNSHDWFAQHLPVNGMFEFGGGLGLLFPSSAHNLQLERAVHQKINSAAELFIRGAWLPIRYAGIEAEAAVGASSTADDVQSYPWALRAHVIGQLPLWRITPFALFGGGRIGNVSNQMGADSDPLMHFGGGAKVYLTDDVLVRLDLRDNLSQKNNSSDGTLTHSPELMVGVSMTLGRPVKPYVTPCVPEDTDGDGIVDRADKCPSLAGEGRDGCPIPDTDKDGILDDKDKCIDVAGVAPDGCPPDTDGDGVVDKYDECPKEKGDAPTGCPAPKDTDGDGLLDAQDKCPKEAENKNGYEDTDGCPDVIPEKVKQFTGVIQGITFDNNKATIRPTSKPTLDSAVAVLKEFPQLRIAISGHTDNTGTRDKNVKLSLDRAESVKNFMVQQGIDASRIETRGAGPDEPVDSNATPAGKERNRRIEFKLIAAK
jgi:OOP family OmpA-OmpF porin